MPGRIDTDDLRGLSRWFGEHTVPGVVTGVSRERHVAATRLTVPAGHKAHGSYD